MLRRFDAFTEDDDETVVREDPEMGGLMRGPIPGGGPEGGGPVGGPRYLPSEPNIRAPNGIGGASSGGLAIGGGPLGGPLGGIPGGPPNFMGAGPRGTADPKTGIVLRRGRGPALRPPKDGLN